MQCKVVWTKDFMAKNFPSCFHNGEWLYHCAKIELIRQKALLPEAQPIATRKRRQKRNVPLVAACGDDIKKFEERLEQARRLKHWLSVGNEPELFNVNLHIWDHPDMYPDDKPAERRAFVQKCPLGKTIEEESVPCKGFLSSSWKCGTCEKYVCKECYGHKASAVDGAHVCNPSDVETVKCIRSCSKPCPGCGVRTQKSEGCNQMWCTSCHKFWDYVRGVLITSGPLHNPEYAAFIAKGGTAAREPGDMVCGGVPSLREQRATIIALREVGFSLPCQHPMSACRLVAHMQDVELRNLAPNRADQDGIDLRISYLLDEIDEKWWQAQLKKRMKQKAKNAEMYSVVRTYVDVSTVMWRNFTGLGVHAYRLDRRIKSATPSWTNASISELPPEIEEQKANLFRQVTRQLEEIEEMRHVFNKAMNRISLSFGKLMTLRIVVDPNSQEFGSTMTDVTWRLIRHKGEKLE